MLSSSEPDTAAAPEPAGVRIAPSASVEPGASVGAGSSVWDLATVRQDASVGENCVIGRGAYLGPGVRVGNNVKIQNQALIYEPAELGDGAFVGPAVVLTNDTYPRAVTPEGRLKTADDWEAVGVRVGEGASLGARSVCVAPVRIGRWALVAAGAVVVRDVPDFALVVGVPARRIGWVGRAGVPLVDEGEGRFRCPTTGRLHQERDGVLTESGAADHHG
ncbi:acyltransferase [Actinospica robiniae]|uniref:acyltransferase n=1 Tax=Actinospica robiniae TaxID=304901 RepID=UPI00041D39E2|nr:acyltransferase [Actinospica robiniae]